ncbi:MAG: pyridoxal-phosphate dependent enzyme [Oligoflexia bacterium]|nr:pyridoxal-phosphate dependent enzyme [Oligoflexia bacterium]
MSYLKSQLKLLSASVSVSLFMVISSGSVWCGPCQETDSNSWISSAQSVLKHVDFKVSDFDVPTKAYYYKTPLIELPTLESIVKAKVGRDIKIFIKDEAQQKNDSFKIRGVLYEIYVAITDVINRAKNHDPKALEILEKGLKIVTQSTGNHGINLISGVADTIDLLLKTESDPYFRELIKKIEPVVFTSKSIADVKKSGMVAAMERYRSSLGLSSGSGILDDRYSSYEEAVNKRKQYIKESEGRALYMEHAGTDIMKGHGSIALEVNDQLKEKGISEDQKLAFLMPVGAGGPLGALTAMKLVRPNSEAIMVQTLTFGAFVRILKEIDQIGYEEYLKHIGTDLEIKNSQTPEPTIEYQYADKKNLKIYFPDGIGVDTPEKNAIGVAMDHLDAAVMVDDREAYHKSSILVQKDLLDHYQDASKARVGGTSAIAAEAVLTFADKLPQMKNADVIVITGTEGNILPEIVEYQKSRLKDVDSIKSGYMP